MFVSLLLCALIAGALGKVKIWQPDSNWENERNWQDGNMPCGGDSAHFEATPHKDSLQVPKFDVHVNTEVRLKKLVFSPGLSLVFGSGSSLVFSDDSTKSCADSLKSPLPSIKTFSGAKFWDWNCPGNWKNEQSNSDVEEPPCGNDVAVFPSNSSFSWVHITSPTRVARLQLGTKDITSSQQLPANQFVIASTASLTVDSSCVQNSCGCSNVHCTGNSLTNTSHPTSSSATIASHTPSQQLLTITTKYSSKPLPTTQTTTKHVTKSLLTTETATERSRTTLPTSETHTQSSHASTQQLLATSSQRSTVRVTTTGTSSQTNRLPTRLSQTPSVTTSTMHRTRGSQKSSHIVHTPASSSRPGTLRSESPSTMRSSSRSGTLTTTSRLDDHYVTSQSVHTSASSSRLGGTSSSVLVTETSNVGHVSTTVDTQEAVTSTSILTNLVKSTGGIRASVPSVQTAMSTLGQHSSTGASRSNGVTTHPLVVICVGGNCDGEKVSAGSSDSATMYIGGGAGGAIVILLIIVCIIGILFWRFKKSVTVTVSGDSTTMFDNPSYGAGDTFKHNPIMLARNPAAHQTPSEVDHIYCELSGEGGSEPL